MFLFVFVAVSAPWTVDIFAKNNGRREIPRRVIRVAERLRPRRICVRGRRALNLFMNSPAHSIRTYTTSGKPRSRGKKRGNRVEQGE